MSRHLSAQLRQLGDFSIDAFDLYFTGEWIAKAVRICFLERLFSHRSLLPIQTRIQRLPIAALCLLLPFNAFAAEQYVFCAMEVKPYTVLNGRQFDGIMPQVLRRVAKELGWDYKIDLLPWKRALSMAKIGACDGVLPAVKNLEREQWLVYPEPVSTVTPVFFVPIDSAITFNGNLQEFVERPNVTIGVTLGFSYAPEFDRLWLENKKHNFDEGPDAEHTFQKFLAHRFSVYVIPKKMGDYNLREIGATEKFKALTPDIGEQPYYIAFSKLGKLAKKVDEYNATVIQLRNAGELAKIEAEN